MGQKKPTKAVTKQAKVHSKKSSRAKNPASLEQFDEKMILRCTFCGKSQDEVSTLIAGPTVYICNECVDICKEILTAHKAEQKKAKSPLKTAKKSQKST